MTYTHEQLKTLLQDLPEDVREAISSVEISDIITDFRKKYNLHIDQTGELSNEILLLTIGATPPQKFVSNLENRMRIPRETATQITTEVNEKIFRPVRESLMQIHKMREAEEKPANEPATSEILAGEIPEKSNEIGKNFAEGKLTEPFSLPKKSSGTPDPYRESTA